jgi:HPt (histidine-containing phosphotransfer) domain-containing protein
MDDLLVLDGARLQLITRGDAALASEFVGALIEESDAVIAQLCSALEACDRVAVSDLAHALKGMATELGAQRLRAVAATLEAEAQPAAWPAHVQAARRAVAELRSFPIGS